MFLKQRPSQLISEIPSHPKRQSRRRKSRRHFNSVVIVLIAIVVIVIMPASSFRNSAVSAFRSVATVGSPKRHARNVQQQQQQQNGCLTAQQLLASTSTNEYESDNKDESSREQQQQQQQQHLVLVGGGHAHAQVIKALNAASRPQNLKVTLIDQKASASYSGMVPGCIAEMYTHDDTLLHLTPLAEWADIEFISDQVVDIDLDEKKVYLSSHNNQEEGKKGNDDDYDEDDDTNNNTNNPISFDCISLDIGSTSRGLDDTPGAREFTIPTRPINKLVERIAQSEQDMMEENKRNEETRPPRIVVIGAGVAGIELSLSLNGRFSSKFENTQVTLLDAGSELLGGESDIAKATLQNIFSEKGISVLHECKVQEITEDRILARVNGKSTAIPYTHCIWATGAGAHSLAYRLQEKGLAATKHAYFSVNEYLQSTSHPFVFAAGDCCNIEGLPNGPPPKAGVFAVRAGPVLIENLTGYLRDSHSSTEHMKKFVPQSDFLKLLVCGDGRALGLRFGQAFVGRWVMEMKDSIDQHFMNLFKPENLPDLSEGEKFDTSQYDDKLATKTNLNPEEGAALLSRADDDVDYKDAFAVIRTMADDDEYCEKTLSFMKAKTAGVNRG